MILVRFCHLSDAPTRWWRYRWAAVPRVGETVCLPGVEGDPGFDRYKVVEVTWTPATEAVQSGALSVHAMGEGCTADVRVER